MQISVKKLEQWLPQAKVLNKNAHSNEILQVSISSKDIGNNQNTLFCAFVGVHNGHHFMEECYRNGVRTFLISDPTFALHPEAIYIVVDDVTLGLQTLASEWRKCWHRLSKVVAITGSNGKTIVKDWLYYVLCFEYDVVRSPLSYNSQIGVPLSILNSKPSADIYLLECGISFPNEMQRLQKIVQPDLGIFTYLGNAHIHHFSSIEQLFNEKLTLFKNCDFTLNTDQVSVDKMKATLSHRLKPWSFHKDIAYTIHKNQTELSYKNHRVQIPYTDDISIYNASTCLTFVVDHDLVSDNVLSRFSSLPVVDLRYSVKIIDKNNRLVADCYNADNLSIMRGVSQIRRMQTNFKNKVLVLSSLDKQHKNIDLEEENELKDIGFDYVFTLGNQERSLQIGRHNTHINDIDILTRSIQNLKLENSLIYVKGSRNHGLEKLTERLENKSHRSILNISYDNLVHNLNLVKREIPPHCKIILMMKANAYGIGVDNMIPLLKQLPIDYIAVAIVDEGRQIRELLPSIPIMVMNVSPNEYELCSEYQLDISIHSDYQLEALSTFNASEDKPLNYHIKIDSGMHRLGFEPDYILPKLKQLNSERGQLIGVFSHLMSSDGESIELKNITQKQLSTFDAFVEELKEVIPNIRAHILNSAGIFNYSEYCYDFVRLGLGLFGFSSVEKIKRKLKPALSLHSKIISIKHLNEGEPIGYSAQHYTSRRTTVGIIPVGYADGIPLSYSMKGIVSIHGKQCRILGRINMDMISVDITDLDDVIIGDKVLIFGDGLPIEYIARQSGTSAYEILTHLSPRILREVIY